MADPQVPWTSGSEILANPGNANLAAGSGAGSLPLQIDTRPVYSVLDKLQEEDAKMRFQKHLEDRADNEALSQTLANMKGKGSVFNMKGADGGNVSFSPLPDDQKILQDKAADLQKMVLKNPDNYDFDPEFLKKKDEYDYLVQHASKRAVIHSQNRLAAAQALDREDQAGYLKNNQDEILAHPLTDFHNPDSYIPKSTIDQEKILPSKEIADKNNYYTIKTGVDNGIQTDMIGLKNDVADVRGRITPGTPGYVEAVKMSQAFIKSMANDPQGVRAMNDRLAKYNAERGYQPGDPHYQPAVATVAPDGKVLFPARPDPAQIVGAIYFDRHGGLTPDRKLTKIQSEEANVKSEIERRRQQTAHDWAELERQRAHDAREAKPSPEQLKLNLDKQKGEAAYREVKQAYDPANYTDKNRLSTLESGKISVLTGFSPAQYSFHDVPEKVQADHYIGIEDKVSTNTEAEKGVTGGEENKTTSTEKDVAGKSEKADKIVMAVDNSTGKGQLIYLKGDKMIAHVPERDAIENKVKHASKYTPNIYTNQATYGQSAYDEGAPTTAPAATATPTGIRKTIKGVTYEKYSDGTVRQIN